MTNNLLPLIDDLLVTAEKLKDIDLEYIKLMEKYKTLSELDADPNSKHRMHMKINKLIIQTLVEIHTYDDCNKSKEVKNNQMIDFDENAQLN
jgi:hypothetical protein